jgi:uncharacterized protein YndB with AHSA1/START domain
MSLEITLGLDIAASSAEVWRCLSEARHIGRWWRKGVVLEPKVGGRFLEPWREPGGADRLTQGRVLAVEPPHRLELSWADDDWPVPTRVAILLETQGPGTRLTLRHGGWSAFPGDQGLGLCKAHEAGWKSHLEAFKDYVEHR